MTRKNWPMKPSGVQLTSPMRPPGRRPGQLVRGDLVARRELHAEDRQDRLEGPRRGTEALGVALAPSRPTRRPARHARRATVNSSGARSSPTTVAPMPRRRDRDVAGAGGDVEHGVARRHGDAAEQVRGRYHVDALGHRGVVAGGPGRAVRLLEVGDRGHVLLLAGGWYWGKRDRPIAPAGRLGVPWPGAPQPLDPPWQRGRRDRPRAGDRDRRDRGAERRRAVADATSPLGAWIYLGVAAFVFLETTVLLGFLIHGELLLMLGGAAAARGDASLVAMIALAWAAAVAGDMVSLLLGRRLGRPFLERHGAACGSAPSSSRGWTASSRGTAPRRCSSAASPASCARRCRSWWAAPA